MPKPASVPLAQSVGIASVPLAKLTLLGKKNRADTDTVRAAVSCRAVSVAQWHGPCQWHGNPCFQSKLEIVVELPPTLAVPVAWQSLLSE